MNYIDLSPVFWFTVHSTILAFVLGAITVFSARKAAGKDNHPLQNFCSKPVFSDDGRVLKIFLVVAGIAGMFFALLQWQYLIKKFGSVTSVLLQANFIYRLRVEGEVEEAIPYLYIISYAGVFLGGIYTAYKGKLTFWGIFPLFAVIIKDIASVGRAGIFLGFLIFLFTVIFFRHFQRTFDRQLYTKTRRKLITAFLITALISVGSANLVKLVRGTAETYKTSTSTLNKFKDVPVLSPSIYLYFSSNMGVLSRYLEEQSEDPLVGSNTFQPVYNIIAKTGAIEKPKSYPKGYLIPMWVNSATYLRDVHADFGHVGIFGIPYLLGVIITFLWLRFYERPDYLTFVLLIYTTLIIGFSTFYMVTRSSAWFISLIFLIIIAPLMRKKMFPSSPDT